MLKKTKLKSSGKLSVFDRIEFMKRINRFDAKMKIRPIYLRENEIELSIFPQVNHFIQAHDFFFLFFNNEYSPE